jgi:hypothetical protein
MMTRFFLLSSFCFLVFSGFCQRENLVLLRYWNGTTDGNGVTNPVGLNVSAVNVPIANALVREEEPTLSGQTPKFYFRKKFVLFFTVENVGKQDVAIYDWAFKAVCPVDNMGRKFDAASMIPLVTPYIPSSIFIVLKPGEKKQFYSGETDFYWCLPQDKNDIAYDPKYFQALITCGSIAGSENTANPNQKLGSFEPTSTTPPRADNSIDIQIQRLIKEHNDLIQQYKNEEAELLKNSILRVTNSAYPAQVNLVESQLNKPQQQAIVDTPIEETETGSLSFNGQAIDVEGECFGNTATLVSEDESSLLVFNNLGSGGSSSVNPNFYTNGCTDCLAIQFQDLNSSQIFIAVSGTVNRTANTITFDLTLKELMSVVEGGGSSYRVSGHIVCE